jgi:hypothetical protein
VGRTIIPQAMVIVLIKNLTLKGTYNDVIPIVIVVVLFLISIAGLGILYYRNRHVEWRSRQTKVIIQLVVNNIIENTFKMGGEVYMVSKACFGRNTQFAIYDFRNHIVGNKELWKSRYASY